MRRGKDTRDAARLKLIAGIIGVGYEELRQRDRRRTIQHRVRIASAAAVAVMVVGIAYLGAADSGLALPGGEAIRLSLDRYDASPLRKAHSMDEIRRTAGTARDLMVERLDREWRARSWIVENRARTIGPKVAISPWVSSQAAYAMARSIAPGDRRMRDLFDILANPFAPGMAIEVNGRKYGWQVDDTDFVQAEPMLWTLAALAVATRRGELFDAGQRSQLASWLDYTEETAELYRPVEDGGWNMFPLQENAANHSTYSTALAFLAMLELRLGKLGWRGDQARLDRMLGATAAWLAIQYNDRSDPRGWRIGPTDPGQIMDGLTLQLYSELLRADEEAGITVQAAILDELSSRIDRLNGRPIDFPTSAGEVSRIFTNFDGAYVARIQYVKLLWHPWAVDTAWRWLRRVERDGAEPEAKVRARRTLGYSVVDLGRLAFPDMGSGKALTYMASEMLIALSEIAPPEDRPSGVPENAEPAKHEQADNRGGQ